MSDCTLQDGATTAVHTKTLLWLHENNYIDKNGSTIGEDTDDCA